MVSCPIAETAGLGIEACCELLFACFLRWAASSPALWARLRLAQAAAQGLSASGGGISFGGGRSELAAEALQSAGAKGRCCATWALW